MQPYGRSKAQICARQISREHKISRVNLHEKIKMARKYARPALSQEDLGKLLSVSRGAVANWESRQLPSSEEVTKIARVLAVPVAWFYDGVDAPPPAQVHETTANEKQPAKVLESGYPVAEEEIDLPVWPALPADSGWDDSDFEPTEFKPVPAWLSRRSAKHPERVLAPIRGDSMSPRLREDDFVLIELDPIPRPGRMFLVRSKDGKSTLKVLDRNSRGEYLLKAINEDAGEVAPKDSLLMGYVVAILRGYRKGRGNVEWDEGGLGP